MSAKNKKINKMALIMSYPFNEAGIVPYCTSGGCVLRAAEPIIPGVRLNTNMGHLAPYHDYPAPGHP